MSWLFNLRKRKMTRVSCPTCGDTCDVPTPPGVFKLEVQCAKAECIQQQLIKPYYPQEEHALYFLNVSANGRIINSKIGSDSDPFSLMMYQRLEIAHTATSEEILDAYNRKRLALNPPAGANAVQNVADIAETARVEEAYKILSVPTTRRNYNKYGLTTDLVIPDEGGFEKLIDVLNLMLGDGKFYDIIGEPVELPRIMETKFEMHAYMPLSAEERQREAVMNANLEEIQLFHIADVLDKKLCRYDPDHEEDFRNQIIIEAGELQRHRNGLKLLHAIGKIYFMLGNYFAMWYSDSNEFYKLLSAYQFFWQHTFHCLQLACQAVKIQADYNFAAAEERDYLAKRWRSVTRRQKLKEALLRVSNDSYWWQCKIEMQVRIFRACHILFKDEKNLVTPRELTLKASALKIIGQIYQKQI